jgi:hypothetical protein
MTIELRAKNITATYRAATDSERVEGRSWYATARAVAESLDPASPEKAAAVIAVLSPRLNWDKNVEAAVSVYKGLHPKVLGANALKAKRIMAGENPDDVVSGPKVRAFWHAIVNPSDPRAIVIDRHAFDVAAGTVLDDEQRGKVLGLKGAYDNVCKLYVRAAQILSRELGHEISPVEVQATTWVAWRRMKKGFGL